LATFQCGFGQTKVSEYRVIGAQGVLKMDPAYTWNGDTKQTIIVKEKEKSRSFKHRDQVAAELVYFAECVQSANEPEPSGREGLIDVMIIDAVRKSYTRKRPVRIKNLPADQRPNDSQSIRRKPHGKPTTVKVKPPSNE
jgi:glucose-fructose oxidoreductase